MSYSCNKHGWAHPFNPYPSCQNFVVTTGTTGTIPDYSVIGVSQSHYDQVCKELAELRQDYKDLREEFSETCEHATNYRLETIEARKEFDEAQKLVDTYFQEQLELHDEVASLQVYRDWAIEARAAILARANAGEDDEEYEAEKNLDALLVKFPGKQDE